MKYSTLFSLLLTPQLVASFGVSSQSSRHDFITQLSKSAAMLVGSTAVTCTGANVQVANAVQTNGVLRSEKCAYGEGSGCESLAGDNEFIKSLQKKSAERKEETKKEFLTAFQMKNYPDYFASLSPPKYMVKKSDGTFNLYDDVELAELKKANRIRLEKPMAMGGKVVDLTQKPYMVLVE